MEIDTMTLTTTRLAVAGGLLGAALALALLLGAATAAAQPAETAADSVRAAQQALCDCNVIVVAKSNGDFTSVVEAMNSITATSSSQRYLVWVGPGVYTETATVQVKPYVHLQGAGPNVTVIASTLGAASPNASAATAQLDDNGRISDLSLVNQGTGTFGIAVHSTLATRGAVLDNVVAEANGSGGTGHYAVYLNDSEITIENSTLRASGAVGFGTAVNAAIGVVNISAGFPQPVIRNSVLTGGNNDVHAKTCAGNSGTGFAIQGVNASPLIVDSYLCGDRRGIFLGTNGTAFVRRSEVWASSTGGSFLFESTSSAAIVITHSGVFYVGNKYTGTGGLVCTYNHLANSAPASDGTTSGTACN
jgi:hypothetical protein